MSAFDRFMKKLSCSEQILLLCLLTLVLAEFGFYNNLERLLSNLELLCVIVLCLSFGLRHFHEDNCRCCKGCLRLCIENQKEYPKMEDHELEADDVVADPPPPPPTASTENKTIPVLSSHYPLRESRRKSVSPLSSSRSSSSVSLASPVLLRAMKLSPLEMDKPPVSLARKKFLGRRSDLCDCSPPVLQDPPHKSLHIEFHDIKPRIDENLVDCIEDETDLKLKTSGAKTITQPPTTSSSKEIDSASPKNPSKTSDSVGGCVFLAPKNPLGKESPLRALVHKIETQAALAQNVNSSKITMKRSLAFKPYSSFSLPSSSENKIYKKRQDTPRFDRMLSRPSLSRHQNEKDRSCSGVLNLNDSFPAMDASEVCPKKQDSQ